ncbi:hypothetical protein PFISCL1PPCAC_21217, partial [Pristionchus fissidentatus]
MGREEKASHHEIGLPSLHGVVSVEYLEHGNMDHLDSNDYFTRWNWTIDRLREERVNRLNGGAYSLLGLLLDSSLLSITSLVHNERS